MNWQKYLPQVRLNYTLKLLLTRLQPVGHTDNKRFDKNLKMGLIL